MMKICDNNETFFLKLSLLFDSPLHQGHVKHKSKEMPPSSVVPSEQSTALAGQKTAHFATRKHQTL